MCFFMCVCVDGFGVAGGRLTVTQALSSINAPICLTCRTLSSSLTMGEGSPLPTALLENGSFGRSLMLMSRPGLGLRAVNRELMRLVVCLCTVVTRLKDGPCPKQLGSFQASSWVPSQALTQRPCPGGFSPVSTPSFPSALPALLHLSPSCM